MIEIVKCLAEVKLKFSEDVMTKLYKTFKPSYRLYKYPYCFTLATSSILREIVDGQTYEKTSKYSNASNISSDEQVEQEEREFKITQKIPEHSRERQPTLDKKL